MIRGWLALWLAMALGIGLPAPAQAADVGSVRSDDPVAGSLLEETDAMLAMVEVIKREVREGRIDLSYDAKLSWQHTVRAWERVQADLARDDLVAAFSAAQAARLEAQRGASEVFSVRASRTVKKALKSYIDTVQPRVDGLRARIDASGQPARYATWKKAKATFEMAKQQAAVEELGNAWPTLLTALGTLDELVLEMVSGETTAAR